MPRARIPYDELESAIQDKYPFPLYKNVRLLRKERYNNVPTPTVVYDRSTGNYAAIGWKVTVSVEQYEGVVEDRRYGYLTKYAPSKFTDIILL